LFGAHDNDFPLYELTRLDNTKKEREENAPLGITFGEGKNEIVEFKYKLTLATYAD